VSRNDGSNVGGKRGLPIGKSVGWGKEKKMLKKTKNRRRGKVGTRECTAKHHFCTSSVKGVPWGEVSLGQRSKEKK